MTEGKVMTMSEDLKGWGIGLLILGGLHFVIPFLSPQWGMVLIPLGILALTVKHRGMFIGIGAGLILVGLLNIAGGLSAGTGFWTVFGGFQIYWGIKEIAKFAIYGRPVHGDHLSEASDILDLEANNNTQ
jgi:hypothetical protein